MVLQRLENTQNLANDFDLAERTSSAACDVPIAMMDVCFEG
jgi:hypothetical protein